MKQKETTHLSYEPNDLLERVSIMSDGELQQAVSNNQYSSEILSQALCDILSDVNYEKTLILLKAGADPNYQNGTPLVVLAQTIQRHEAITCLELLHEFGAKMDGTNGQNQGFTMAVAEGNKPVVEKMLEYGGMDLTFRQSESLCTAATEGHADIVQILLNQDPRQNFNEAFCVAAEHGHTDVMDVLIERINREEIKHDALERATFFEEYNSVYHMIEKQNFSTNQYDNSFVETAISSSNQEFVQYTIAKLDNPLQVVQDPQIMSYVQLNKPELITSITESMKNNVQQTVKSSTGNAPNINQSHTL